MTYVMPLKAAGDSPVSPIKRLITKEARSATISGKDVLFIGDYEFPS